MSIRSALPLVATLIFFSLSPATSGGIEEIKIASTGPAVSTLPKLGQQAESFPMLPSRLSSINPYWSLRAKTPCRSTKYATGHLPNKLGETWKPLG